MLATVAQGAVQAVIDWRSVEWPTICPFCGQHHDAASPLRGDHVPDDGDVSFCFGCGAFCVFDDNAYGGLRKPTKKEQRGFDRDKRLQEMTGAWKVVKRQ
jgi:hypothetical protein